ncbi:MAG: hypothetical protein ACR5LC_08170 [Symbiopectobacterium sp.]|uniref:hypothetical protein n=1 Tax=Symbiopectobacterium sp. TaxID=2952789 RepID=UPI003F3061F8
MTTREELRLNTGVERVIALPRNVRRFGVTTLINHISEPDNREARENGVKIRLARWAQWGDLA